MTLGKPFAVASSWLSKAFGWFLLGDCWWGAFSGAAGDRGPRGLLAGGAEPAPDGGAGDAPHCRNPDRAERLLLLVVVDMGDCVSW
ncbi:hypothetical protein KP509_02G003900 [Ceratopteris richardii]|uniref:Secreted protein n=1 Tax=Ceratopteris richardii TaxID=49495 RepID=A0A8T2VAM9_CERRI|nr:hypothetical protein KP509_02G003900 [Ceratopteris richardii]